MQFNKPQVLKLSAVCKNVNAYQQDVNLIVQFQKISILPPRKVFRFAPLLLLGNSSLALCFTSKILTFKTPLPLGIFDDLPWGGCEFFLELHISK